METKNFMNKVHEVMISLVMYKIWGECNITIDTENFMNKVYEVIYSRSSTSSRVNETTPLTLSPS